jgi:hypothetical protein
MHQSTFIVLVLLTLGQIFMLTCGVLVLWLMGEFGSARDIDHAGQRADERQQASIGPSGRSGKQPVARSDDLLRLMDDYSIQPDALQDRAANDDAAAGRKPFDHLPGAA